MHNEVASRRQSAIPSAHRIARASKSAMLKSSQREPLPHRAERNACSNAGIKQGTVQLLADDAGQGWRQALEIENQRLQAELDSLRQRAVTTPQHDLRARNERLTAQLRELEKRDKTRAQLGSEVAQLKQQLDEARRSNGKNGSAALRRQLKVRESVGQWHSVLAGGSCFS